MEVTQLFYWLTQRINTCIAGRVSEQDDLLPSFPSEKTVRDQFYFKATNMLCPNLCDSTGSSYSTHQGQLFQELALVTRLTHHEKVHSKEVIFPLFFFKDKAHCFCACVRLTCIMQIFLQDTNDNPLVTNITMVYASLKSNARQWDWTLTCMFYGLFNYCTLPSVFTEEMMYFLRFFTFLEKLKIIAYQVIKYGVKWRCCVIFTKYGDKKSVGSSFFGA